MRVLHIAALSGCLIAASASLVRAQVYVYPLQGQSPAPQQRDEGECYNWATRQTGYQPGQSGQVGRSGLRGAARGAAGGAIIGGISGGSAGKGAGAGALIGGLGGSARGAARDQNAQNNWTRAFEACMDARGYSVR